MTNDEDLYTEDDFIRYAEDEIREAREDRAKKRLEDTAPELLAALQIAESYIVSRLDEHDELFKDCPCKESDTYRGNIVEDLEVVRYVIAKAKGEI